jgi:hypothetical protein
MDIKVVSKVQIKVTQEDIEEMIKIKIAEFDPKINLESIEFIQKRNPSRIAVEVLAQYGEVDAPPAVPAPTMEEPSEPVAATTVEDIFAG